MGADTSPQALVRVYESAKDQWLPLATMPTPRYGAASFLRGNKIYVLGELSIILTVANHSEEININFPPTTVTE